MSKDQHHVKEREQRRILDYATSVLATLGEKRWVVLLMKDPSDDDCNASVCVFRERYIVQLYLNRDWHEYSDSTRRNTITHEMLHVVHARIDDVIYTLGDYGIRRREHRAVKRRYQTEVERMVDHFATVMSDVFRLHEAWDLAWVNAKKGKAPAVYEEDELP